jgi:1-pyrroline-5-carboxylate dehydrogenase
VLASPHLGGVHFTGSTGVFNGIWRTIGNGIDGYRQYPRLVGETGGKDFVFAHASADPVALAANLLRGAFEYQGQKCSAASRAYIPESLWPRIRDALAAGVEEIAVGDVSDFRNFMGAVIDRGSWDKLRDAAAHARAAVGGDVIEVFGREPDNHEGWFVPPTVVVAANPRYATMCDELFGPLLTIHVYPDRAFAETLGLCDGTSPYALTGAIFARDRSAILQATDALRHSAGNFYVNDKPTGAVVGQQPFGGGRASGTNDKAGSAMNLLRWLSARTIKETFDPPRSWRYPFLDEA